MQQFCLHHTRVCNLDKMNIFTVHCTKNALFYIRCLFNVQKFIPLIYSPGYVTSVDTIDAFTVELLHRRRTQTRQLDFKSMAIRNFTKTEGIPKDLANMSVEEVDETALQFMTKKKDKTFLDFLSKCTIERKVMSDVTIKKLLRNYSILGRTDIVKSIQSYCAEVNPCLNKRNGNFTHYLAKAECMKGNADKGLSILLDCYNKNEGLRSFYRIIFRELIQDTVLNRSEASLVIFKRYVLEFSNEFSDHYPLVCFWHLCWSSSWFSDQMLANELLDTSSQLRNIVKDKSLAFSITILRQEYNEDAVLRLLQNLLQYYMMDEYTKVLQILFAYKLKNQDVRGCAEIIKNCEVLGITLPSYQQGKYIRMLIDGSSSDKPSPTKPKNFKLKF